MCDYRTSCARWVASSIAARSRYEVHPTALHATSPPVRPSIQRPRGWRGSRLVCTSVVRTHRPRAATVVVCAASYAGTMVSRLTSEDQRKTGCSFVLSVGSGSGFRGFFFLFLVSCHESHRACEQLQNQIIVNGTRRSWHRRIPFLVRSPPPVWLCSSSYPDCAQ